MDEIFDRAAREVGAWPLWKLSYDVRGELAALHGLEIPADLELTVDEWLEAAR